jgi:hypothetical protein
MSSLLLQVGAAAAVVEQVKAKCGVESSCVYINSALKTVHTTFMWIKKIHGPHFSNLDLARLPVDS